MIHETCKMIANFLYHNDIIREDEIAVYTYGYETFISGLIDFSFALLFGFLFHRMICAIIFFIMFVSVRMHTGGYHADSYTKCKMLFSLMISFVLGTTYMNLSVYCVILMMIIFLLIVWKYAPIENPNKPLTIEDKERYCFISQIFSASWSLIAIIIYFSMPCISVTIASTAFVIALLVIAGVSKNDKIY
ncbi:MAG: accessory gene regulator B family protein [Oscillospiraceae bacterium]|nr:accessory gene regulator B family protein [Oscillospiraceae bacterium]